MNIITYPDALWLRFMNLYRCSLELDSSYRLKSVHNSAEFIRKLKPKNDQMDNL